MGWGGGNWVGNVGVWCEGFKGWVGGDWVVKGIDFNARSRNSSQVLFVGRNQSGVGVGFCLGKKQQSRFCKSHKIIILINCISERVDDSSNRPKETLGRMTETLFLLACFKL